MAKSLHELRDHMVRLGMCKEGVAWVVRALSSPPARRVGGTPYRNNAARYASREMGFVVQAESSTGELAELLECEFDRDRVLAFVDQPKEPIVIRITRKDGVGSTTTHTVDSLQVRSDGVFAVEVKADSRLRQLILQRPKDWIKSGSQYRFLPAEEEFARLGITYVVKSTSSYSTIRAENLQLLIQARRCPAIAGFARMKKSALKLVSESALSLRELGGLLRIEDLTPLLQMIGDGTLTVDTYNSRLSTPDAAWVGADPDSLAAVSLKHNGFLPDAKATSDVSTSDALTHKKAKSAAYCLRQLRLGAASDRSPRTLRRYRQKLRDAGGNPAALAYRYWDRGRRRSRLPAAHDRFIRNVIREVYGTSVAPSIYATYLEYRRRFQKTRLAKSGHKKIQFNTFARRVTWLDGEELARGRGGYRLANSKAAPVDPSHATLRASRYFQKAHIDHYLCDLWAIVAQTSIATYVARPVLSVMQDEYSGEVLAIHLGFTAPSKKSCAGVLRDCVRRHGRLPEWVVVDQGPEFRSTYFETTLAEYEVSKQERAKAASRWGGSLERTFGVTKRELYGSLPGNTSDKTVVRSISPSHRPQRTARLFLYDVYKMTERYFFNHWNMHPRGTATVSPSLMAAESIATFGCSGIPVSYDKKFIIATAIPAARNSYPVDAQRGVRIGERWYRSDRLTRGGVQSAEDVKLEPWDDNTIYFTAGGTWCTGHSKSPYSGPVGNQILRMCESITRGDTAALLGEMKRVRDDELASLLHLARTNMQSRPDKRTRATPPEKESRRTKDQKIPSRIRNRRLKASAVSEVL